MVGSDGVRVIVADGKPDWLSTVLTRVWAVVAVLPGKAATRQPSRAAEVTTWTAIPSRAHSSIPRSKIRNTGSTRANSTAAAPRRFDDRFPNFIIHLLQVSVCQLMIQHRTPRPA